MHDAQEQKSNGKIVSTFPQQKKVNNKPVLHVTLMIRKRFGKIVSIEVTYNMMCTLHNRNNC
jgi:hypothetical protein